MRLQTSPYHENSIFSSKIHQNYISSTQRDYHLVEKYIYKFLWKMIMDKKLNLSHILEKHYQ